MIETHTARPLCSIGGALGATGLTKPPARESHGKTRKGMSRRDMATLGCPRGHRVTTIPVFNSIKKTGGSNRYPPPPPSSKTKRFSSRGTAANLVFFC